MGFVGACAALVALATWASPGPPRKLPEVSAFAPNMTAVTSVKIVSHEDATVVVEVAGCDGVPSGFAIAYGAGSSEVFVLADRQPTTEDCGGEHRFVLSHERFATTKVTPA